MNRGKIPKEVIAIFEKYQESNVRSLKKKDAVRLFKSEFGLNDVEAEIMFDTFDKDKNGIMSIWEFQQFFQTAGSNMQEVVKKFHELDTDHSGKLDSDEARKGLEAMKTGTGRNLEEREIEFFMKTATDENGMLDLGTFTNLLFRLKLYKSPPPPKNVKTHVLGSEVDNPSVK